MNSDFCGHILKEGKSRPSPDKVFPLKLWQLSQTIIAFRGRLGKTNDFSEYVSSCASVTASLVEELKVSREEGNK